MEEQPFPFWSSKHTIQTFHRRPHSSPPAEKWWKEDIVHWIVAQVKHGLSLNVIMSISAWSSILSLSCKNDDMGSRDVLRAQSQAASHLPWVQGREEAYWKGSGPNAPSEETLDLQLYYLVDRWETNRLVTCIKGNQKYSSLHNALC